MWSRLIGFLADVRRNHAAGVNLPRFLTYLVTFGCNARCIMCDSWKKTATDDLTLEEIDCILAQLPRMDAVRLSGGEPFVREDLPEIAACVLQHLRPLVLHVTTNGFLTSRIVRFCEERDRRVPLQLLVSVDGVGDKHNRVRGSSVAWNTVCETLRELAPRQRELHLRLGVNQTIVDAEGAEQYERLHAFLQPFNVAHHLVMAYEVSATYSLNPEVNVAPREAGQFATFGTFTDHDLRQLLDAAERDLVELPFWERIAKRYYLRGIRNRLLYKSAVPNPPCVALNSHLRIFPNGDVPTCQFNTERIGNLRRQSFQEIWHGSKSENQRQWVRECPGCWAECEVVPNAIYTLDLTRALDFRRTKPSRETPSDGLAPASA